MYSFSNFRWCERKCVSVFTNPLVQHFITTFLQYDFLQVLIIVGNGCLMTVCTAFQFHDNTFLLTCFLRNHGEGFGDFYFHFVYHFGDFGWQLWNSNLKCCIKGLGSKPWLLRVSLSYKVLMPLPQKRIFRYRYHRQWNQTRHTWN